MTAEEFIDQELYDGVEPSGYFHGAAWDFFEQKMIQFADYHVKEALKEAANQSDGFTEHCPREVILDAYNLNDIRF